MKAVGEAIGARPRRPPAHPRGAAVSPPGSAAAGGAAVLRVPAAPAAIVMVRLPVGDAAALQRVARRTATAEDEVARAAHRPGWWAWAPSLAPGPAARLRGQAERAGLQAEVRSTGVSSPSFLPALVAGGLAQLPLYVSTGMPALDAAVLGGLGATALFSLVRAGRGIAPARASAAAAGAWAAWTRATRTHGPELALLTLELRLAEPGALGAVATDLADTLDEAWSRLFALPAGPSRAADQLNRAAHRVLALLDDTDSTELIAALRALARG